MWNFSSYDLKPFSLCSFATWWSSLIEHLFHSFAWSLKIYLFIWQCLLLVAARGICSLLAACRIFSCSVWDLVPDQGWNLDPLHWHCGVLAIGPPEKPPFFLIIVGGSRVHSTIFFLMSIGPKCTSLPVSIMYLFHTQFTHIWNFIMFFFPSVPLGRRKYSNVEHLSSMENGPKLQDCQHRL